MWLCYIPHTVILGINVSLYVKPHANCYIGFYYLLKVDEVLYWSASGHDLQAGSHVFNSDDPQVGLTDTTFLFDEKLDWRNISSSLTSVYIRTYISMCIHICFLK